MPREEPKVGRFYTISIPHLQLDDTIEVVWNAPLEGPTEEILSGKPDPVGLTTSMGKFYKVIKGYIVLSKVFTETLDNKLVYQERVWEKWLSIPLGAVVRINKLAEKVKVARGEKSKTTNFIVRRRRRANGQVDSMISRAR